MGNVTPFPVCVALLFSAVSHAGPALNVQDSPSFEDVTLARKKALQQNPVKDLEAATGKDPAKSIPQTDILADSDIICFQGIATLVPKRAILLAPKNYSGYLKFQAGSKFVNWGDFLNANRAWITTVEVTRAQAEGKEALSEQSAKLVATSRNLVVATFRGGPISVLPPVERMTKNSMESNKP